MRPLNSARIRDLVGALDRIPHVEELLPEICSLDCGSYNFGEGSLVYVSTPDMLRRGAKRLQQLGVRPELEIFDTGHLSFTLQMMREGLLDDPPPVPALPRHSLGRSGGCRLCSRHGWIFCRPEPTGQPLP